MSRSLPNTTCALYIQYETDYNLDEKDVTHPDNPASKLTIILLHSFQETYKIKCISFF